ITTIAMDSTPPLRRQAYEYLCANTDAFGPVKAETPVIAEALLLPTNTVRRALEDLAAYQLVRRIKGGKGQADAWVATPPKGPIKRRQFASRTWPRRPVKSGAKMGISARATNALGCWITTPFSNRTRRISFIGIRKTLESS